MSTPGDAGVVGVAIDAPYPFPSPEGIVCELFCPGGTLLRFSAPELNAGEIQCLRFGVTHQAVRRIGPSTLEIDWHFAGKTFGTTHFDADLARHHDRLELPVLDTPESRATIQLHVVDTATNLVRGLRYFTLSPKTTRELVDALS